MLIYKRNCKRQYLNLRFGCVTRNRSQTSTKKEKKYKRIQQLRVKVQADDRIELMMNTIDRSSHINLNQMYHLTPMNPTTPMNLYPHIDHLNICIKEFIINIQYNSNLQSVHDSLKLSTIVNQSVNIFGYCALTKNTFFIRSSSDDSISS